MGPILLPMDGMEDWGNKTRKRLRYFPKIMLRVFGE